MRPRKKQAPGGEIVTPARPRGISGRCGVHQTCWSSHVVLKVVPTGKLDQDPFVVEVKNGQATGVKVGVRMAFGTVRNEREAPLL